MHSVVKIAWYKLCSQLYNTVVYKMQGNFLPNVYSVKFFKQSINANTKPHPKKLSTLFVIANSF